MPTTKRHLWYCCLQGKLCDHRLVFRLSGNLSTIVTDQAGLVFVLISVMVWSGLCTYIYDGVVWSLYLYLWWSGLVFVLISMMSLHHKSTWRHGYHIDSRLTLYNFLILIIPLIDILHCGSCFENVPIVEEHQAIRGTERESTWRTNWWVSFLHSPLFKISRFPLIFSYPVCFFSFHVFSWPYEHNIHFIIKSYKVRSIMDGNSPNCLCLLTVQAECHIDIQ